MPVSALHEGLRQVHQPAEVVLGGAEGPCSELLGVCHPALLVERSDRGFARRELGIEDHLSRRLAAHRSGAASRYTHSRRPVELAAVISVADRFAALREEARIKRLPRAAKLRLIAAAQPQMPKAS